MNPLLLRQVYDYFRGLVCSGKEENIETRKGFKVLKALEDEFPWLMNGDPTMLTTVMAPSSGNIFSIPREILRDRSHSQISEITNLSDQAVASTSISRNKLIDTDIGNQIVTTKKAPPSQSLHLGMKRNIHSIKATVSLDLTSGETQPQQQKQQQQSQPQQQRGREQTNNEIEESPSKKQRVNPALVRAVLQELEGPSEISPASDQSSASVESSNQIGSTILSASLKVEEESSSESESECESESESTRDSISIQEMRQLNSQWNDRYQQLVKFRNKFGHCNVPLKWRMNRALGKWVSEQRLHYSQWLECKHSVLSEEQRALLESIGLVTKRLPSHNKNWDKSWDERYKQLLEYKEQYGNTKVPKNWATNRQLGIWVMNQRTQYQRWLMGKDSTLGKERRERLEAIGFDAGKYQNLVHLKRKMLMEAS